MQAPTNAARSFQPQYGAVRELAGYDLMTARTTDGSETLLNHALPVPRDGESQEDPCYWLDFNSSPVAPP